MLDAEEIDKIAELSRLDLTEEEKEMYAKQLSVVFDYVKILQEVDTEGVAETCQVTGLEDVLRNDDVLECEEEVKEKLIKEFPDRTDNLLKVKQVFSN